MPPREHDLGDWFCAGQTDLTELVEVEHIAGSMPAADADREAARRQFYESLKKKMGEQ